MVAFYNVKVAICRKMNGPTGTFTGYCKRRGKYKSDSAEMYSKQIVIDLLLKFIVKMCIPSEDASKNK